MNLERSKALRHEFQLIQEQQQRKLLARKQRKTRTADRTTQENDVESGTENYWGHNGDSDNLDLKVCTAFWKAIQLSSDQYSKLKWVSGKKVSV